MQRLHQICHDVTPPTRPGRKRCVPLGGDSRCRHHAVYFHSHSCFIFVRFIRCALSFQPGCVSGMFNLSDNKLNVCVCGHAGGERTSPLPWNASLSCLALVEPMAIGRWRCGEPLKPHRNSASVELENGGRPARSPGGDGPSNRPLLPPGLERGRLRRQSCR